MAAKTCDNKVSRGQSMYKEINVSHRLEGDHYTNLRLSHSHRTSTHDRANLSQIVILCIYMWRNDYLHYSMLTYIVVSGNAVSIAK